VPVAAEVGGDDVETSREARLGEPPESAAVGLDTVEADDERRFGVAPLVGV